MILLLFVVFLLLRFFILLQLRSIVFLLLVNLIIFLLLKPIMLTLNRIVSHHVGGLNVEIGGFVLTVIIILFAPGVDLTVALLFM